MLQLNYFISFTNNIITELTTRKFPFRNISAETVFLELNMSDVDLVFNFISVCIVFVYVNGEWWEFALKTLSFQSMSFKPALSIKL